ncbi:MAG TPA: glycosyltransferase, partial [Acetobacteraceae bacterium]|nr:glycosyltransferase [Acetobacteraceae bacterium]
QKGMDLLLAALPTLLAEGGQLAVLGAGEGWMEQALRQTVALHPGRVGCFIGYDEALAHLVQGGADALLVPSRFEPCGLTQLCALRYGTVPVVARVGGLADTVIDASPMAVSAGVATGVQFTPVATAMLEAAIRRAAALHRAPETWRRMQRNGMALDGLLRGRGAAVGGILNGIDTAVWNPATDSLLPAPYDAERLQARARNREDLQFRLSLAEDPAAPLFAVISRLTAQKGMDLLLAALPTLLAEGGQLAVLGAGEGWMEQALRQAVALHPGRVGCFIGYDEALAHLVQGGADALLVPSRFEPCGLTQLCALRYGTVPVVARVGGLADTVIDASPMAVSAGVATGVQFTPVATEMLEAAIRRAAALHRAPETWRRMQRNGMATDVSWRDPARRYAALYRDIAG